VGLNQKGVYKNYIPTTNKRIA